MIVPLLFVMKMGKYREPVIMTFLIVINIFCCHRAFLADGLTFLENENSDNSKFSLAYICNDLMVDTSTFTIGLMIFVTSFWPVRGTLFLTFVQFFIFVAIMPEAYTEENFKDWDFGTFVKLGFALSGPFYFITI